MHSGTYCQFLAHYKNPDLIYLNFGAKFSHTFFIFAPKKGVKNYFLHQNCGLFFMSQKVVILPSVSSSQSQNRMAPWQLHKIVRTTMRKVVTDDSEIRRQELGIE